MGEGETNNEAGKVIILVLVVLSGLSLLLQIALCVRHCCRPRQVNAEETTRLIFVAPPNLEAPPPPSFSYHALH